MFAVKRIDKIKEIMLEYRHVDIPSLSSILSVSEATIRRDLEKLEQEGFLKRTYGGAVLNEDTIPEVSAPKKDVPYAEEKRLIGCIASQLVENNEVIAVGSGTTCLQFVKHLKGKKNLTIVTNNLLIPDELDGNKDIKVILTGGDVFKADNCKSLIGEFAHKMIQGIYVKKAFLGVEGVHLEHGYTTNFPELALVWNKVAEIAEEIIVLADYSKFGRKNFIKLAPLNIADKIVTNQEVPEEFMKYYFENNIPVYTKYELKT